MQSQTLSIDALLTAPANEANAEALWAWVARLQERILRGDVALGLLSQEDLDKVPRALARVAGVMPEAWLDLAFWHIAPPLGAPDVAAAEQAVRAAMDAEVPTAVLRWVQLAWMHQRDTLAPDAQRERFERLQQVLQAEPQQAEALNLAGYLTTAGFGTAPDPAAGLALHEQAAELLNTDALFEIAIHHFNGLGVPADAAAGLRAMQRAANEGHPRALYNLGAFHAAGHYMEKDPVQAVRWYERAAEAGHVQALVNLASLHALGDGLPVDTAKAAACLDEAEAQGLDVDALRAQLLN